MATNSKTKGVAIGKRAKIDKAQSIMIGVVCGASLILGITIVGVIYFVKTISYQGKWVSHITDAAKTYESVQNNLNSVAEGVRALGDNENLESVATKTPDRKTCMDFDVNEKITPDNVSKFRTCSALRVIPDTIPTSEKNITAALGSMTKLLYVSNGGEGVSFSGIAESEATEIFSDTFHTIGVGLTLQDYSSKVRNALDTIESSVRNYDLQSAMIRFGEEKDENDETQPGKATIEFSGTYATYYSDKVNVELHTETLCADPKNESCPGDTLTNGTQNAAASTEVQ